MTAHQAQDKTTMVETGKLLWVSPTTIRVSRLVTIPTFRGFAYNGPICVLHAVAFFFARTFAHLFFCAALMSAIAFADSLRRLRVGLRPAYTPAKAESAAFNPDNCRSTRSRSFFNCFTMSDMVAMLVPPHGLRA